MLSSPAARQQTCSATTNGALTLAKCLTNIIQLNPFNSLSLTLWHLGRLSHLSKVTHSVNGEAQIQTAVSSNPRAVALTIILS